MATGTDEGNIAPLGITLLNNFALPSIVGRVSDALNVLTGSCGDNSRGY